MLDMVSPVSNTRQQYFVVHKINLVPINLVENTVAKSVNIYYDWEQY